MEIKIHLSLFVRFSTRDDVNKFFRLKVNFALEF